MTFPTISTNTCISYKYLFCLLVVSCFTFYAFHTSSRRFLVLRCFIYHSGSTESPRSVDGPLRRGRTRRRSDKIVDVQLCHWHTATRRGTPRRSRHSPILTPDAVQFLPIPVIPASNFFFHVILFIARRRARKFPSSFPSIFPVCSFQSRLSRCHPSATTQFLLSRFVPVRLHLCFQISCSSKRLSTSGPPVRGVVPDTVLTITPKRVQFTSS